MFTKHRKRRLLGVSLLTLGLAAASVSPVSAGVPAAKAKKGGTLTFLHQAEATSMDPASATVFNGILSQVNRGAAIYDVLVYEDQETGAIVPRIARSLTSTDGLTWILKLREGVTFSDGTPYDAEAVKFGIERNLDPALRSPSAPQAGLIASMTVTDATTLQIVLKTVNFAFDNLVARQFAMIPSPTAVRARGATFGQNPVGAGPFVMKEWRQGDQMILDRNPNYWDKGKPYLDQIIHKVVTDPEQRYNTLTANGADMVMQSPGQGSIVARATDAGYKTSVTTSPGGSAYHLNLQKPPFNDIRIRQFLAIGPDWKGMHDVLNGGQTDAVDTLFPKGHPEYSNIRLAHDLKKHNPTKAQQLLDDYAKEKGGPATFTIMQSTGSAAPGASTGEWLLAQLSRFNNVKATVEFATLPQTLVACANRSADMIALGDSFYDASFLRDGYYTNATRNCGSWSNPAFDKAIDTLGNAKGSSVRAEAFKTIQEELAKDIPSIFYQRAYQALVFQKKVRGVTQIGPWTPLWAEINLKGV